MDENEITTVADTQAEKTCRYSRHRSDNAHHRGAYPAAYGESGGT